MTPSYFFLQLSVMAGVTYLIRMLPLAAVKGRIRSQFVRSFLFYVPYAVLAAMTFPDILYSTGNLASAAAALAVALVLALRERSLLTVALSACGAALLFHWAPCSFPAVPGVSSDGSHYMTLNRQSQA